MTDIVRKKKFPTSYPKDVLEIIDEMSMTDTKGIKVLGSMSLRSQQYAGDYDLTDVVTGKYKSDDEAIDTYVRKFKSIIKHFLHRKDCYIGDIKSGEIAEWKVIPDDMKDYKHLESLKKLKSLWSANIITKEEYDEAKELLVRIPSQESFLVMQDNIKFHIVRWSPKDILGGAKKLADGRTYWLKDAFSSPSITKLDIIAFVQNNRFTDFSCIYIFENKGRVLNKVDTERIEEGIKNSIIIYKADNNWFKIAKRMFSLARLEKNVRKLEKLNDILNGDLGRLYSIISDANTILYLLENETEIPIDKIRYEIDQFRERFANIYTLKNVIRKEPYILEQVLSMETLPNTSEGRKKLQAQMEKLVDFFQDILNKKAKQELEEVGLV